jgi:tetratricopeptide (TPR) repeat protein
MPMSEWQEQNDGNWKRIEFALTELRGPGIVWMTCDSYRHSQRIFADFKARFADRVHYELRIKDSSEGHLRRIFVTRLPKEAFEGEGGMVMVHVFGLESQVGIGMSPANEDFFAALNLDREALFLRTPFIIIFWTDLQTQIKVQRLVQDFWDWVTMKFQFEAPVEAVKSEIDWMEEPKTLVPPERRDELLLQNARYIGKLDNLTRPRDRLSHLEVIADNYQALQDYSKAAYSREEVLKMRDLLLPGQLARHLNELGIAYKSLGMIEQASQAYEECRFIFEEIGDRMSEGRTLNNLSQIYKVQGDYPKALAYLERSLLIMQEIGDRAGEGVTLNNLATLAFAQGDYPQALGYLERSLQVRQEIGDRPGEGTALNNLSQIYVAQGDSPKALGYLERSLQIQQEIGDRTGEGATLINLSQIYMAQGDSPKALAYLERSLLIQQEVGDRVGEGATLNNLSEIYYAQGDYPQALAYLERSLHICKEIGDIDGMATTFHNLGILSFERGDFQTALPYFVKAAAIWKQLGSPHQKHPEDHLAAIEAKLGPEAYASLLAQLPQNEDPLDLSSLPKIDLA